MSLSESPTFGDGSENAPLEEKPVSDQIPEDKPPSGRSKPLRIIIALLVIGILVSGILLVLRTSGTGQSQTGSVTVTGQIVNSSGEPIANAQVYVEGLAFAVTTDQTGTFKISGAKEGQVVVVIGVTPEPPHFEVVTAQANSTKDLGKIVLPQSGQ